MVMLLWVYYSAQILLFGAKITRAYSVRRGRRPDLAPLVAADTSTGRGGASGREMVAWIVFSSLLTALLLRPWRSR